MQTAGVTATTSLFTVTNAACPASVCYTSPYFAPDVVFQVNATAKTVDGMALTVSCGSFTNTITSPTTPTGIIIWL